jgi:single-stranded-DNA-specific exonuclease
LAAIATICDVCELCDENRLLVKYALTQGHLKKCQNHGLQALLELNGLADKALTSFHVAFIVGPCLNATGRLDSAVRSLALLRAQDQEEALIIAKELKALNESRKEMTEKGIAKAVALVEEEKLKGELPTVLILYLPDCHESLAGIIAGRIRERYQRPTFVLVDGEDGIKGSGRSTAAYHMYDELCKCAELFTRYGGHQLAAGLSLPAENMEAFRRAIAENAQISEEDLVEKVQIDIAMPLDCASRSLVDELELMEPFGHGNRKPLFAQKDLRLLQGRRMGKNGRAARYKISDSEGRRHEIVYFGDIEVFDEFLSHHYSREQVNELYEGNSSSIERAMKINMTYYPDLNEYQGVESVQIVMQNYQHTTP